MERVRPALEKALAKQQLVLGAPLFIRIFKQPGVLEVWLQNPQGAFVLFKSYDICYFSGGLGPKTRQGDRQSPEGFYYVTPAQLNPNSRYHLSFNLGYPNSYDRAHGRTGNYLMVHGKCVSIGCYAMTNAAIDEIYSLAVAAFKNGQPFFRVHAFPFRLTEQKLRRYQRHRWYDFWLNLKTGYELFEHYRQPPNVEVENGRYRFDPPPA